LIIAVLLLFNPAPALAGELSLRELIDEALRNNPDILMSDARVSAAEYRIPQAESLPDPMFMFGYENDGTRDIYTFGDEMAADSRWMFSVSQMFPFPGKLSLKSEMSSRNAEGMKASSASLRLKTIARVKELYYDLFLAYKNTGLLQEMTGLFSRVEDAALARYSTGMAQQQEVLMAQTEKYMLLETGEMLTQKVQSIEAMLNSVTGRDVNAPLGMPSEPPFTAYNHDMDELIRAAHENSPEIKAGRKMIEEAETRVEMARKDYYPDLTVNAGYSAKGPDLPDMWSLTTSINIPLFYKTKQRQAVLEARSSMSEARYGLEAAELMIASAVKENYSMLKTSERLMDLYKNGLAPRVHQDFESALSGYVTGKAEAITVITRLKALIDYELSYWRQFAEREKTIARLEALTTIEAQR